MDKFEKQFAEIAEWTKGMTLAKTAIGWGVLSFGGAPYCRYYKGRYGEGIEVHYDAFQAKNGNFYHHVNYYVK